MVTKPLLATPASNRALPLDHNFRGKNGTIVNVGRTELPRDTRIHYRVMWQTTLMAAPAFWYFTDPVEANTSALKLLQEWIEIPNSTEVA